MRDCAFDCNQNKTIKNKKPFSPDKLYYNKEKNHYICPMGQQMKKAGTLTRKITTGFTQTITRYQAVSCVIPPPDTKKTQ